jgi:hypothetical protein
MVFELLIRDLHAAPIGVSSGIPDFKPLPCLCLQDERVRSPQRDFLGRIGKFNRVL